MTELYPDDTTLLAMDQDADTGVELIPTGKSPYFLEFRKLVQRLLLAATRANDLRVYQDGGLTVGVRPGRCSVQNTQLQFAGTAAVAVSNNQTTSIWLDSTGSIATGASGLPTDRTTFVPLAQVTASAGSITAIDDLRGQAFLNVPDAASIGLNATASEIDQALTGINATVDAAALNTLTAGPSSPADTEHHHRHFQHDSDSEIELRLSNANAGSSANIALYFQLGAKLPGVTALLPDMSTGWLNQRFGADTYALIGVLPIGYQRGGDLAATLTDQMLGVVPANGAVSDVILSLGSNIESDTSTDGVAATVSVNGTALTSTNPIITDADGAGFRCTDQGDGTAAVVKSDGTEQVARGDVLTVTLSRTAAGSISSEAADIGVLVIVRPGGPE